MLTEAGRTFLPYAEAVLAALKDGRQAVQALQGQDHGVVSLAIVGTLAGTTIVEQLRRFSARHRNARLELRTANSFEVSDMVRRGEVSLGLRYFGDLSPELVSQQISEERILVVCSAQHKWGGKRLRDPEQLRTDQWLSLPMTRHRDSFAHLVARQLASARLDEVSIMVIDSLTAQKRLIEAGIGIALLPESTIQEELRLGTLRTIDIPCLQTTVPIHVLYRKHGYLTGASRTLSALLRFARRPPRIKIGRESHPRHDVLHQRELSGTRLAPYVRKGSNSAVRACPRQVWSCPMSGHCRR